MNYISILVLSALVSTGYSDAFEKCEGIIVFDGGVDLMLGRAPIDEIDEIARSTRLGLKPVHFYRKFGYPVFFETTNGIDKILYRQVSYTPNISYNCDSGDTRLRFSVEDAWIALKLDSSGVIDCRYGSHSEILVGALNLPEHEERAGADGLAECAGMRNVE